MSAEGIIYTPIGTIYSEHVEVEATPIQPAFAKDCFGQAIVQPEFEEGLRDLDGFSHIYLLYHFHLANKRQLLVKPYLQDEARGVFATRANCRPNPIGLSVVELMRREKNVLHLKGVDVLNGTPLLDIKPYISRFDRIATSHNGWQDQVDDETARRLGRRDFRGRTPGGKS